MPFDPQRHHRRSIRLRGYDYSQSGAYFVTLCVQGRRCLFGEIVEGAMYTNDAGRIASDCWSWLAQQYSYVELDAWVLMPNHLHGIILLSFDDLVEGGSRTAPTCQRKPLGRLIGAFKTISTKRINQLGRGPAPSVWQRNYYEHIIRSEESLRQLRTYIDGNVAQWADDQLNPISPSKW